MSKKNKVNGYNLTRQWYQFKFENINLCRHVHSDLYFFILYLWNELGQPEKFGLPTASTMQAIGVGSYNTYKKALAEIVAFGFVEIKQDAVNQYQSKIIALSKTDEARDKALDKATDNARDKATDEPPDKALDSIIELQTTNSKLQTTNSIEGPDNEIFEVEMWPTFDDFWNAYDKKVGPKERLKKKWNKLKQEEREMAMQHLEEYKQATPDKKFRKNPETYLNQKSWNDEIIQPTASNSNYKNGKSEQQKKAEYADLEKQLRQLYSYG